MRDQQHIDNHFAVVGLGYVGLGLAIAFSHRGLLWGYDINPQRIQQLKQHIDSNHLVPEDVLAASSQTLRLTGDVADIQQANFYIISVATPAHYYETPDLEPLIGATRNIASVLKHGDIVVFESTVYPGTTEEICIPILEQISHLKNGKDFHVGYSPERINPGDPAHTLKNITKIVSAQDPVTLKRINDAYLTICNQVFPVNNIRTAESIKLLENTQRDVNIALMNEFSIIMHALDVNMHDVLEGAKTKWGFIPFKPGFVGGHCISIDPHYLAFKAKRHGVYPELILTARKVNDDMPQFIIQSMLKLLIKNKLSTQQLRIGLFGLTYKENVLDIRNSLALKLHKELLAYGFDCQLHDPLIKQVKNNSIQLTDFADLKDLSVIILITGHDYYQDIGLAKICSTGHKKVIFMDIPNLFIKQYQSVNNLIYWNL